MSNPTPDVRELIDEFAERLLALAGGEQIPGEWKRHLLQRLAPEPKPRGRHLNLARLESVAYEIARRSLGPRPAVAKTSPYAGYPDKAKPVLPEEEKRRISKQYGCSVRTITNMQRIVEAFIPEHPKEPARSPSDEECRAVLCGLARAIGDRGRLKDEEGQRRRKERLENARGRLMEGS